VRPLVSLPVARLESIDGRQVRPETAPPVGGTRASEACSFSDGARLCVLSFGYAPVSSLDQGCSNESA